jgi:hypothetical protein
VLLGLFERNLSATQMARSGVLQLKAQLGCLQKESFPRIWPFTTPMQSWEKPWIQICAARD